MTIKGGMKDLFGDQSYVLPTPSARRAFDGDTYEPKRDYVRLNAQQRRVFDVMQDGKWRTLAEVESITGDPQASISARFRDFRKEKYGLHTIEREYLADGLFRYRLIINRNVSNED